MKSLYQFMKKAAIWTAVLSAIAFVIVGICSPIEPGMSVFGHVMKTFVMWLFVLVILEVLMYSFSQILHAWINEKKDRHGKGWFWKGIWEDLKSIWGQITWKRVLFVIGFFAAVLVLFGIAELFSRLVAK